MRQTIMEEERKMVLQNSSGRGCIMFNPGLRPRSPIAVVVLGAINTDLSNL